jgi:hypothetical protein
MKPIGPTKTPPFSPPRWLVKFFFTDGTDIAIPCASSPLEIETTISKFVWIKISGYNINRDKLKYYYIEEYAGPLWDYEDPLN